MRLHPGLVLATVLAVGLSACTSGNRGDLPRLTPTPPGTALSSGEHPGSGSQPSPAGGTATQDWPMYHRTVDRAGVATLMPPVSTLRLAVNLRLDAPMYASPVAADDTIIAATEGNTVYAFDPSGRQLWSRNLGTPSPSGERPCGNIDPLGITGTPVVVGTTVYVSPELGGPPRHQLVALDLRTGTVRWRRSVDLAGVETAAMQERGALTVSGGRIWVPFGGLAGDCGGYKGRVVGVSLDGSGALVSYTVPTTREAGIWTPPGPSVDAAGNLFVAVGNGASGVGDRYDYSDSVLEIGTDGRLLQNFSPTSWPTDNDSDLDLGSQGPALVGNWVFTAGKSGTAYVLARSRLGGIGGQVSKAEICVSFGGSAVSGDIVYVPCTDGVRAVRVDRDGRLHVLWHAEDGIAGSPVIGGGRVWALDQNAGILHALDPATGRTEEQVDVGVTSRFATPAIYGSDVFVPTLSGMAVVSTG